MLRIDLVVIEEVPGAGASPYFEIGRNFRNNSFVESFSSAGKSNFAFQAYAGAHVSRSTGMDGVCETFVGVCMPASLLEDFKKQMSVKDRLLDGEHFLWNASLSREEAEIEGFGRLLAEIGVDILLEPVPSFLLEAFSRLTHTRGAPAG